MKLRLKSTRKVKLVRKKSLPTLIWSKLCKNVDIWSNHASKKQLKTFFSHLLHAYLHSVTSSFQEPGVQEIDKCKLLKTITLSQISSELLNDSLFYEQKVRPSFGYTQFIFTPHTNTHNNRVAY